MTKVVTCADARIALETAVEDVRAAYDGAEADAAEIEAKRWADPLQRFIDDAEATQAEVARLRDMLDAVRAEKMAVLAERQP